MRAYREGIVAKKFKGLEGLVEGARHHRRQRVRAASRPGPSVRVGDDVYRGTDVILATGSYSRTLPGLEIGGRILASEQALELDEIPERVIVLGGGVIGVEFASVWKSFGADVTIVEALDHLVPNEDIALSKALERAFRRRGIAYSLGRAVPERDADIGCRHGDARGRQDVRGGLPPRRRRARPGDAPDSATRRRASPSTAAS